MFVLRVVKLILDWLGISFLVNWLINRRWNKTMLEIENWADSNKLVLNKDIKADEMRIEYDENKWNDLVNRLNITRFFEPLGSDQAPTSEYGFDVNYAKELVDYWKSGFDWRNQVNQIKKFKHYQISLDGINLHFIRVNENKFTHSNMIPLLMLNGWPESFYTYYKAIDHINEHYNNEKRYFEIILPSIPGFPFSQTLNKKVDIVDTARLYDGLMRHLYGEKCKYFVHGEDWGSIIGKTISQMYPSRVAGLHVTLTSITYWFDKINLFKSILATLLPTAMLTTNEIRSGLDFSLFKRMKRMTKLGGYFHLQATKPDTLGFGLTDSPVGLLAYILEKFSLGSFSYSTKILGRKDGGLESAFSKDELLTIVTLYWMTNTITPSMRFYKNYVDMLTSNDRKKTEIAKSPTPKQIPVGIVYFPYEIDHSPYTVLQHLYLNIKSYKIQNTGGHFAAFHEPKLLTKDLINFIDSNLNTHK